MPTSEVLTPTLYNVTMTSADTEYSQALPTNTRYVSIQTRDGTAFRVAFVTGKVATPTAPFLTIRADSAYNTPEKLAIGSPTLYFACASAGKIVEIVAWCLPTPVGAT